jgi:4-coumarate--CoA ligase
LQLVQLSVLSQQLRLTRQVRITVSFICHFTNLVLFIYILQLPFQFSYNRKYFFVHYRKKLKLKLLTPLPLGLFIEAAQVNWLFVSPEFLTEILLAAPNWKIDKTRILVFDPPGGMTPYTGRLPRFSSLLSADESRWKNPYQGKDPKKLIAVRSFGSGTSGNIKAIEISQAAQLARLDAPLFAPDPRDTAWLQNIGLSHVSSLNMCQQACAGRLPMALTSVTDAPTFLDRIQAGSISQIQLSPAMMESMTETITSGLRSKDCLKSLSTVLVGGTFSRKVSVEEFMALLPSHTRVRTGYGSTEAGIVSMTPIDTPWELGFCGVLTPKVELK